jgi:hypothetical protein
MWNDYFEPKHHDPIQHDHDPKFNTLNDLFPGSRGMKGGQCLRRSDVYIQLYNLGLISFRFPGFWDGIMMISRFVELEYSQ